MRGLIKKFFADARAAPFFARAAGSFRPASAPPAPMRAIIGFVLLANPIVLRYN